MQFNSLAFAVFLPIVFALYWILPHKVRWVLLLIASYYFYMSWNPKYVILILITTFVSYEAAILLEKGGSIRRKNWIVAGAMIICLGILFVFKYLNFALDSIAAICRAFSFNVSLPVSKLLLPVGISFYTFQTLSYVVDVYRGSVKAERNFGVYATFVSFFPQLVAGPIERTSNLLPQIKEEHRFDYDTAVYGLRLMLWGLFKKVVVADTLAVYVDKVYSNVTNYKGMDLLLVILYFTVQIYCDFSGYSDIAIGTAKLMGINLMTNFKSPYFAASIKEFWGRWHISLSTWFRDYLYIPMGGNRCSKLRHYFNIMVTFLVSGLWHGANWTYVCWGGMHGFVQVLEDIFKNPLKKLKSSRFMNAVCIIIVFGLCNIGWVFFRADTFSDAFYVLRNMFSGITNLKEFYHNTIGMNHTRYAGIFGAIAFVGLVDFFALKRDVIEWLGKLWTPARLLIQYTLIILVLWFALENMGSNQFVYFQF